MSNSNPCTCCSLACAICRILVHHCLHRVVGRAEDGYQRQRPEYNILCLGLQGAGKSTLLAKLAGESTENIEETKGFSYKSLLRDNVILQVQELGGSDKIRPYWNKYFSKQHGLIFVVDSSSTNTDVELAKQELTKTVQSDELQGKPVLILLTKQDKPDAKNSEQMENLLDLHSIMKFNYYYIEGCSDGDCSQGIDWLAEALDNSEQ